MKITKRVIALLLTGVLLCAIIPIAIAEEGSPYKVGSIIQFGTYPRSLIKDEEWIAELDAVEKDWVSYEYFSGTGNEYDGRMKSSDFMKYADFFCKGVRYRAVQFDSFRPADTHQTRDANHSRQDENSYFENTIYYFIFEAIPWRILDVNAGLVISEDIIDSQPYSNVVFKNGREYYTGMTSPYYANDYVHSFIREWLNNDFYNTAFTNNQKDNILNTSINNDSIYDSYPQFNYEPTNDKVFLLSYLDVINKDYGFAENGTANNTRRTARSTDYSWSQGLSYSKDNSYTLQAPWRLRTAGNASSRSMVISPGGSIDANSYPANRTTIGIRPACCLSILKSDIQNHDHDYTSVIVEPTCIQSGSTTYSCKYCDYSYTKVEEATGKHFPSETVIENEVAATCKAKGRYDEVVYCTVCGDEISRKTIETEKLRHVNAEPVIENRREATCADVGSYDSVVYCRECGTQLSRETVVLKKLNHAPGEPVETISHAATCDNKGETKITVRCTVCNTVISEKTETVPALGHTDADNNGICDRCKQQMTGGNTCKYCGKVHDGAFGWLISFFHSILAIFKR